MKKYLVSLSLLLGLLLNVIAQDSSYQACNYTKDGFRLPFRILFPENFDSTAQYPVILFLHGAGERGNDNQKQLIHGSGFFLNHNQKPNDPAVVIFPQCPEESYWASVEFKTNDNGSRKFIFAPETGPTVPLSAVMRLMDSIISQNWSDNHRIYLGGLSMGGMGTYELLYHMPHTFAAAFSICGGGMENKLAPKIAQTPLWIFHGDADDVVPVEFSVKMANAIKEANGEPLLTIYEGVGHNAWDKVFQEPDLLNWLFSNKLTRP